MNFNSDEKTDGENNVEESSKSYSTVSQRRKRISSTSTLVKPSVSVPSEPHPLSTVNQEAPQPNSIPTKEKQPCSDRFRIYKAQKLREMLKEELRKEKVREKNQNFDCCLLDCYFYVSQASFGRKISICSIFMEKQNTRNLPYVNRVSPFINKMIKKHYGLRSYFFHDTNFYIFYSSISFIVFGKGHKQKFHSHTHTTHARIFMK